jgi:hypothetical protein
MGVKTRFRLVYPPIEQRKRDVYISSPIKNLILLFLHEIQALCVDAKEDISSGYAHRVHKGRDEKGGVYLPSQLD